MRDESLFYSSVSEVLMSSGLDKTDYKYFADKTDTEFEEYVLTNLKQVKDLIDSYTRIDFSVKGVREGIHAIANRICCNILLQNKQRLEGGFVSVTDGSTMRIDDTILTTSVRRDLDMYKRRASGGVRATKKVSLRG